MPHIPTHIRCRGAHRTPAPARRGSIIVAIIVALIMLQVVVIGVVTLGSKDQNLTLLRLEASKDQYAAEAGMNMALREMYNSADEDTDGGIGSISAKTINGVSVTVTMSVSGSITTLTSIATSTNASRKIVVTLSS